MSRGTLCVLTLHRVVPRLEQDHDLRIESFERVLDLIGATEATTDLRLSARSAVALTLDDATEDHLAAAERLAERNLRAILFVPAAKLGCRGHLDERALRRLVSLGHSVGSHGLSHIRLERLPQPALRYELEASRDVLGQLTGSAPRYFAPPGGSDHPALAAELEAAGYEASRSTRWGLYHSDAQRLRIPSVPVTELTLRRGWVEAALAGVLPCAMRAVFAGKRALPARVHATARRVANRRGG